MKTPSPSSSRPAVGENEIRRRSSFTVPYHVQEGPAEGDNAPTAAKPRRRASTSGRRGSFLSPWHSPPVSLTPLRMLQESPFMNWLTGEEDIRSLSKFFTVHHFRENERLPDSPFYLVASGLVTVFTDTGSHDAVTHGRGSFFVSITAPVEVSKSRAPKSLLGACCGSGSDVWDEWIEIDTDSEDEEAPAPAGRRTGPAGGAPAAAAGSAAAKAMRSGSATFERDRALQLARGQSGMFAHDDRKRSVPAMSSSNGFQQQPPRRSSSLENAPNQRGSIGPHTGLAIPAIRRAVTRVTAQTEGDVLILTDHYRMHRLMRASPPCQTAVHEVATLEAQLLQLPLFFMANLTNVTRLHLRDLVSYRAVQPNERITMAEDNGEAFYIVMAGCVEVCDVLDARASFRLGLGTTAPDGILGEARRYKPVKQRYTEGQYFGGASLFKDAKSRTTGKQMEAFASTLTLLACVSEANFPRLLQIDEAVQRMLCAEAKRRLLFSFRSARIPFFCEMSDNLVAKFAECASLVPVEAGEPIDTDTEEMKGLYIVADGCVEATVSGASTAPSHADKWTLRFGNYFGELGLMLPDSSTLDVRYRAGPEEVTLLVLPLAAFAALFGKDRSLMAELRMKIHQQNASLMTVLEHQRARALFIEHLKKIGKGTETQLHFYEAVTQYLQLEPSGFKAAARAIAEGILTEYVPDYAMSKVELKDPLRRDMLQAMRDGKIDHYPELLQRSRDEVYSELERIALPPFTASEPFLHLLHTLSSGNDLTELQNELRAFEA